MSELHCSACWISRTAKHWRAQIWKLQSANAGAGCCTKMGAPLRFASCQPLAPVIVTQ